MDPTEWHQVHHDGSVRRSAAIKRAPAPPLHESKPRVSCWRMAMHCAYGSSRDHPADAICVGQAAPSRYNILLEDKETGSVTEEDSEEECTASGRITAEVRWQAWPRQHR